MAGKNIAKAAVFGVALAAAVFSAVFTSYPNPNGPPLTRHEQIVGNLKETYPDKPAEWYEAAAANIENGIPENMSAMMAEFNLNQEQAEAAQSYIAARIPDDVAVYAAKGGKDQAWVAEVKDIKALGKALDGAVAVQGVLDAIRGNAALTGTTWE
jgi:hypothetical protein